MPQFFLAQILIVVFVVRLGWFQIGPGDWTHLILPAIALALPAIGRLTMVVRSSMIDELNSQYVKAAKAKGLRQRRIVAMHAMRNAAIPFVTLGGWEFIRALAGYTVVVEAVFGWPGLGSTAILAIKERDFFLIQTIVLVVAVMVVIVNIITDAYNHANPEWAPESYIVSKAALVTLTRTLVPQLGPHNITINNLAPGWTRTERTPSDINDTDWVLQVPMRRISEAEDVGDVCVFLLSDLARHITGCYIPVNGGMTVLLGA
jgi:ABC-type proline/glycine betaine transport system permease subunit